MWLNGLIGIFQIYTGQNQIQESPDEKITSFSEFFNYPKIFEFEIFCSGLRVRIIRVLSPGGGWTAFGGKRQAVEAEAFFPFDDPD